LPKRLMPTVHVCNPEGLTLGSSQLPEDGRVVDLVFDGRVVCLLVSLGPSSVCALSPSEQTYEIWTASPGGEVRRWRLPNVVGDLGQVFFSSDGTEFLVFAGRKLTMYRFGRTS